MKKESLHRSFLRKGMWLCVLLFGIHGSADAQSYNLTFNQNAGNPPPGLVTTDLMTTGSIILGATTMSVNQWSPVQTLPFPFVFYGVPVSQYKVSANGVLTFDVASAILPGSNTTVPTASLPDLSIAFMWDDFTNAPPTGSGDYVRTATYGTAPNRQQWIWYYSYEIGNPNYSFAYWALVLEETTNNFYVVDQYSATGGTSGTTVGAQLNATTGIMDPLSPNILHPGNGTSLADNDYWFFQYLAAPCAGAPAVGTTTSSADSACVNDIINLGVSGASLASGIAYQWQSSPNGITWSNIPGAVNQSHSTSISMALNFRRRDICTATADTVYSVPKFVNTKLFLNCYCTSNATSTIDEDIVLVQVGALSNASPSPNCGTYSDFTGSVAPVSLFKNLSYNARVDVGDCEGVNFYSNAVAIFIDYNRNGSFAEPDERVFFTALQPAAAVVTHAGAFTVPVTAATGITRMRVIAVENLAGNAINPCGTYAYGETEDYYVNLLPQPANEVKLVSVDNPGIAACSFNNDLLVTLKNNGTATLNSASFDVNTGGLLQNGIVWNGSIAPGATQQVQVPGIFSYNDGDTLHVRVRLPNGSADTDTTDNRRGQRTWLALNGVYKVGYGVNNLDSIADIPTAINRLQLRGVCDTVYFDLKDGIYTGRYEIQAYPGWNSGEMVIFRSASQNAANVQLRDSATTAATNYIFRLNGADGVGFSQLSFRPLSAAFRTAIDLLNGADYAFIDQNKFYADTTLNGSATGNFDQILIRSANATTDHHTVITNNLFSGGTRAINLGSAAGQYETDHIIKGNTIRNVSYIGVIVNGAYGLQFENNDIEIAPYTSLASPIGLQYSGSVGAGTVSGNNIRSSREGNLVLLSNVKGITGIPLMLTNNFLYSSDSVHVTGAAAIRVNDVNSTGIAIANNSISYYGNNTASGALVLNDGSDIALYNNNIAVWNDAYTLRVDKTYSLSASDHNNLYSAGTFFSSYNSTAQANLAAWQSATGKDGASMSVTPGFNGSDLHTCTPQLNGAGMPLAYVTADFDGDARSATPDIGADEFFGGPDGLLTTEDNFLKCPSESVSFGGAGISGVSYSWTPGGATTPMLTTTAAGTYVITGTSACGSFSDTVVVSNKPLPVAAFNVSSSFGLSAAFNNTSSGANSYLWNFGDGTTSTDVSPTHIYSAGGTYVITLTAYGDCDTVTTTQTFLAIALSNEETEAGSISLYPNPAVENVQISFAGVSGGETEIVVLDMSAKVLRTANTNVSSGSVYTLDVNGLVPGVYMVRITMGDAVSVHRIVKK